MRLERTWFGTLLVRGCENSRPLRVHDFSEEAQQIGALLLVALEKARIELHCRGQLKFVVPLAHRFPDEPDRTALGIAGLHGAREELLEVFLTAYICLAECRDFFDEALNTCPRCFNALFLGHRWGGKVGAGAANARSLGSDRLAKLGETSFEAALQPELTLPAAAPIVTS